MMQRCVRDLRNSEVCMLCTHEVIGSSPIISTSKKGANLINNFSLYCLGLLLYSVEALQAPLQFALQFLRFPLQEGYIMLQRSIAGSRHILDLRPSTHTVRPHATARLLHPTLTSAVDKPYKQHVKPSLWIKPVVQAVVWSSLLLEDLNNVSAMPKDIVIVIESLNFFAPHMSCTAPVCRTI